MSITKTSDLKSRKFISVDPSKCNGCGICEYSCTLEKGESFWNPIRSRIRVVRMTPFFNFALTCRFCEDPKCVKACPEKALLRSSNSGILIVDDSKCKGCDWCSQACEYGGITIHIDTGKAIACNLCDGEPKCVEMCPEEALNLVDSDEAGDKRFNDARAKLPEQIEKLAETVKSNNWAPLLEATDKRSVKVAEKLEILNKKSQELKDKEKQKQALKA